ncbi:hypothetical protein [Scytonema sp. PRP1]|uniref:hypothetical protein n=1 Tax=Scytonema sp. PRP1 TaxID=3120513 RepID=UPI002FD1227A
MNVKKFRLSFLLKALELCTSEHIPVVDEAMKATFASTIELLSFILQCEAARTAKHKSVISRATT